MNSDERTEPDSRSFTEAYLQTLVGLGQAGRELAQFTVLVSVMGIWAILPLLVGAGLEILDVVEWGEWQTGGIFVFTVLWIGVVGVPSIVAACEVMDID